MKKQSTFFSQAKIQNAISNCTKYPWAKAIQTEAIEAAKPYLTYSDSELWDMVFSSNLVRSWMVLSDGTCPSCGAGVPMYNWIIDPDTHAWKAKCPHCGELFPKNDFYRYYRSGLDPAGIFRYELADSSLLFNEEHPKESDPLHFFGVDDGRGYEAGGKRYLFIGTYLVYGQWKKRILDAIKKLSAAYVLTGEKPYAHKTAVLLDRLADFFPDFDWKTQGVMYDGVHTNEGFISYNIDSAGECLELGLAYDRIFDAIGDDAELTEFLSQKAKQTGIPNPKNTLDLIKKNIEERILRESILHAYDKCNCNYPHSELMDMMDRAILSWPESKEEILPMIDAVMKKATAVDGVSGEKSIGGYAAAAPGGIVEIFSWFRQADESFFTELYRRYPNLGDTFAFHIDTWCLNQFYPAVGDAAMFSEVSDGCRAIGWCGNADFQRSWLWRLYQLTGDVRFVQAQYYAKPQPDENFSPSSIFDPNVEAEGAEFWKVLDTHGLDFHQTSMNKPHWHIGLLRFGQKENERVTWMSYDSGGAHGHKNGMNLGLFGKGLDLITDLGYPPVHCGGGWLSPQVQWYGSTASHNTVVIDGKDQLGKHEFDVKEAGHTTLWADGKAFRAMRFSGTKMYENSRQYERGVYVIDLSDRDFYILDIFRVIGGKEHMKFQQATCGEVSTEGFCLKPAELNPFGGFMKDYRGEQNVPSGWSVDWKVRDVSHEPYHDTDVHVRYTDLTEGAEAYLAEGWYAKSFSSTEEGYLTRAVTRRSSDGAPLASNFVSVIEPYEGKRTLKEIKRLDLQYEDGSKASPQDCAVEVLRADGKTDLLISIDQEDPLGQKQGHTGSAMIQPDWNVRFRGDFCRIEKGENGIERIVLCNAQELLIDQIRICPASPVGFAEILVQDGKLVPLTGTLPD